MTELTITCVPLAAERCRLPSYSDYTNSTFKENKIDIRTKTMVKEVKDKVIVAQNERKETVEYPYGLLVW